MTGLSVATAMASGHSTMAPTSLHPRMLRAEPVCGRKEVRSGRLQGAGGDVQYASGDLSVFTCSACRNGAHVSPCLSNSSSNSSSFSASAGAAAVRSSVSFPIVRVACKGLARRNVLGRGLKCGIGGSRVQRRHAAECMYTAATSTDSSVSTKPVDGEDGGDSLPSLSNKPMLTLRPSAKKENDKDLTTPPLKPAPRPALRLRPKEQGARTVSDGDTGVEESSNGSLNSVTKIGLRTGVSRPDTNVTRSDSAAIQSLNQILESAEKLGAGEATIKSREKPAGSVAERPRPQTTQPGAWRAGDKLRSKAEREKAVAALVEERPDISRSDTEASTSSSLVSTSPSMNQTQVTRPQPPPSLTTQAKPVLRARVPTSEAAAVRPRAPPGGTLGDRLVKKGPVLRDIGAGPRSTSSRSSAASPLAAAAAAPAKAFTKAPPPKGKEDWRKKSNVSDGVKRRVSARDKESLDVVTADLNIDIPGAPAARRGGRKMNKASRKAIRAEAARAAAPVKVDILEVGLEGMSCQELAQKLAINDSEIVKVLFMKGIGTTVNQTLDEETVKLVCKEFDVEVVEAGSLKVEDMAKKTNVFLDDEDFDHLVARSPVVTIMGHVDHGKTSLLDFIRKSKVAAGEAGGITQGIGAYSVRVQVDSEEQTCVFLDTPGHEAFSAMRARGARVTDIAVIVVAADDGVRPQTLEAIAHAKAANVPIVIAINKIDKEGANPDQVMQELSTHGLMPEDWGGDVPMVQVSARTGANVDSLLETLMLVAEFQELKANPNRSAKGTVIEASLDKARGALATLLVQNGTLRRGDVVLCGEAYGKVRALMDETGARVEEAGPSIAVQILGLNTVPVAGDEFEIVDTVDGARTRAAAHGEVMRSSRLVALAGEGKVTLHSFANAVAASQESGVERHQLNLVLKVDAQGSVEAIREVLQALPQDTVALRFLMQSTGEISASDLDLAIASDAIVVGFNVGLQPGVQTRADAEGVEIRLYKVIYDLVDDIRKAMEGLLGDVEEEVPIGEAEVRAVFGAGSGRVAGCMVNEGKIVKGCGIRVMRQSTAVHVGIVDSLRRVKEAAKEVVSGLECGLGVDGFNEWQEGDILQAFKKVAKRRSLEDASVTVNAAVTANTSRQ